MGGARVLNDSLLSGWSIHHHRGNISGILALFAPYAPISDAGVAIINPMEGQRAL